MPTIEIEIFCAECGAGSAHLLSRRANYIEVAQFGETGITYDVLDDDHLEVAVGFDTLDQAQQRAVGYVSEQGLVPKA